jgi:hypothetical protein
MKGQLPVPSRFYYDLSAKKLPPAKNTFFPLFRHKYFTITNEKAKLVAPHPDFAGHTALKADTKYVDTTYSVKPCYHK